MKKLLYFFTFLFLGLAFNLSAQPDIDIRNNAGVSVVGDTIVFNHVVDPNDQWQYFENKNFIDILNKSGNSMTMGLIRHEIQAVPNTYDYLCWGNQCFGEVQAGTQPFWDVNDSVAVNNNDTASGLLGGLVIYHRPNTNAGVSIYEYELYNRANRNMSSSVFVKLQTSFTTSLEDETKDNLAFTIYPNPVENQVNVSFEKGATLANAQLVIHDIVGKRVKAQSVQAATINQSISVSELESGLYFVSLQIDGERRITKRFVKN
ncbi:MAG: T9SS type A sorting domain-containing protein [Vicingaceae bacterium]